MRAALKRPNRPRKGVTLVEMLVVVALVVLMMVILVQIFQSATGAMSASRSIQDLDVSLRQVDLRLRQDLAGVTARMTPPLDPTQKLGYFEYGENSFADAQGEDTDDYLAFTTKAPEGQVFTGRAFIVGTLNTANQNSSGNQAIQPITITSQLAEIVYFLRNGNLYRRVFLIVPERKGTLSANFANRFNAISTDPSVQMSWIGVNDISARPNTAPGANVPPIPNDLGDLTNRENRAFKPRFSNSYYHYSNSVSAGSLTQTPADDGIPDDFNMDDVPDFYPTLYPNLVLNNPTGLLNEAGFSNNFPIRTSAATTSYDVLAFPFIYPGMFSHPETVAPYQLGAGWIHSLDPSQTTYLTTYPNVYTGNHAPLAINDNLPTPDPTVPGQLQTWFGFPTWRETLSVNWRDPVRGLGYNGSLSQIPGLSPFNPSSVPALNSPNYLPPVAGQYGSDGAGSATFNQFYNFPGVWEDDLVLSNVRSFDVKAYDLDAPLYSANGYITSPGYYDLGYGLQANPQLGLNSPVLQGFGHAGRIPPLTTDNRLNPSRPLRPDGSPNNVGDDSNGVIRLTRVWDTWSTEYTHAPSIDIALNGYQSMPVYPSYPAPYTAPLRGIQIQIRVADPRNERVKVLTIRQDFTDKL
ncbi:prepilin-type N-terminal cleavage/methylation domain-containing protein [Tundrisphaera lichenicola]|uniref:prepilin-type N-terminal cleavage/methylation domain-containing protein n=1 Tax=Tundrisphaera lichenicola TaxID=2029860 RepID=UPI003EBA0D3C